MNNRNGFINVTSRDSKQARELIKKMKHITSKNYKKEKRNRANHRSLTCD